MLMMPAPRVLIVDDHPQARQLLRLLLAQVSSSPVSEASDGEEALRLLEVEKFDVVTIDMMMQPLDGAELYKHISAMNLQSEYPVKALGLTVAPYGEVSMRARSYGLEHVFMKPVNPKEFADIISDVLH